MIFRDAMYLNSMLVSSETWYYINQKNMEILCAADAKFFQLCFQSNSKTARDAFYMETGKLKINHLIAKRRFLFLQTILKRDPSEMIRKVYEAQKLKTCRYDWINLIKNDKLQYQINLSDREIADMSKASYKKYIEQKINLYFFNELMKSNKSKVQNTKNTLKHDNNFKIPMQPYLRTNELTTYKKQALFSLRNRSYNLKSNYRSMYEEDMRCRACLEDDSNEDKIHVFEQCSVFKNEMESSNNVKFSHIFGTLKQQINAILHFMPVINKRDIILELGEKH